MANAPDDDPVFDALWQRASADLGDDAAQRALLEHAERTSRLPILARRYRERRAAADQGEAAIVDQRLAAITALALGALAREQTTVASSKRPAWLVALAALVLATALYGLYAAVALR